MPWFPDIVSAAQLARQETRAAGQADPVAQGRRMGVGMNRVNHQVRLAARPSGLPSASDWEVTAESAPQPVAGEVVVEVAYLSIDPAMRRWINPGPSYYEPVAIGAVMEDLHFDVAIDYKSADARHLAVPNRRPARALRPEPPHRPLPARAHPLNDRSTIS